VIDRRTFLGALARWGLHPAAAAQTRAAALALPAFADVTRESKIDFRCAASHTAQKYLIETMVGGVAMFDDVTVRWPQGLTETLTGVPANQWIVIGEGKGLVRSRPFERTVQ
jgi:hypothetical protein